ncbi:MAG: archaeal flagellin N-terminal-like domain protein [Halonotius sp. J07HN4]|jgi:archaeal flagellin N-terminal-like domain|nr:MAG: archaeal flagellin N-terminal-like domain protein [Halonotius sp. J07HN4]
MVDRASLTDARGVSPVIGVILMVALTVILATVLGTVVLDFTGSISEQPPQAAFDYEFTDENVTITHVSGDRMEEGSLRVQIGDKEALEDRVDDGWSGDITAGDSVTIDRTAAGAGKNTVRIIWQNPSDSSANTLDSREWP